MLKYFHPITHKMYASEDKDPPEGKKGLELATQSIWAIYIYIYIYIYISN